MDRKRGGGKKWKKGTGGLFGKSKRAPSSREMFRWDRGGSHVAFTLGVQRPAGDENHEMLVGFVQNKTLMLDSISRSNALTKCVLPLLVSTAELYGDLRNGITNSMRAQGGHCRIVIRVTQVLFV